MSVTGWVWFFMVVSVASLGIAALFAREVLAADTGTAAMQAIADAIKEGAEAFMKRQYKTIYGMSVALAVLLFVFYDITKGSQLAWMTVISFFAGAVCSGLAGFSGMFVSIRANLRAANAARTSLNRALQLALRGGAVTGLSVVALSLLGVGLIFIGFGGNAQSEGRAVRDRRIRFRREFRGAVRAIGRRNLHQGGGCWRGPGGQGRSRNSRGRSAQSGGDRGFGGRQRGRLRGARRGFI
jgi:Na+/H+-translocating membrane pyrophosphatase